MVLSLQLHQPVDAADADSYLSLVSHPVSRWKHACARERETGCVCACGKESLAFQSACLRAHVRVCEWMYARDRECACVNVQVSVSQRESVCPVDTSCVLHRRSICVCVFPCCIFEAYVCVYFVCMCMCIVPFGPTCVCKSCLRLAARSLHRLLTIRSLYVALVVITRFHTSGHLLGHLRCEGMEGNFVY